MNFRIIDPSGGEIRNLVHEARGSHLGSLVCDVPQGTSISTSGSEIECYTDASFSTLIRVLKVENVENGPGYIRTDILEKISP